MLWEDKLNSWNQGIIQEYPEDIEKRFFYETSACTENLDSKYEELFIERDSLSSLEQDFQLFEEHISHSKNKYVISFYNPSKTCKLIIPIPKRRTDFTTIKDFIDTASLTHQKTFWKFAAKEIKNIFQETGWSKVYVSTHGLGVPYFHLRLDKTPKYYTSKQFK